MGHITTYYPGSDTNHTQFSLEEPYDRKKTIQDLLQVDALTPQFTVEFEQDSLPYRISALINKIFSCFFYLPYSIGHFLARCIIVPATLQNQKQLAKPRFELMMTPGWVVKRTAIYLNVEGVTIDVCLMGKQENLLNGKWILTAMPNAACYESISQGMRENRDLANELDANIICFNYPGVGASTGSANPETMAKAYKAVLLLLENKIKATQIIHYGRSMGGGVQALALDGWNFNSRVQHVCIKDRSFSSISDVADGMLGRIGKAAVGILGWEIDSKVASIRLGCPEIILQTGKANLSPPARQPWFWECVQMQATTLLEHDGVLAASATLASVLRKHYNDNPPDTSGDRKYYFVTGSGHNGSVDIDPIADKVREILGEQRPQTGGTLAFLWQGVSALFNKSRRDLPKSLFAA